MGHDRDFESMGNDELLSFILSKHERKVARDARQWRNIDRWEYEDAEEEILSRMESD